MIITLYGGPFDLKPIEAPDAPTEYIVPIEPTVIQLAMRRDDNPYPVKRAIYYRIGSSLEYRFSSILGWE